MDDFDFLDAKILGSPYQTATAAPLDELDEKILRPQSWRRHLAMPDWAQQAARGVADRLTQTYQGLATADQQIARPPTPEAPNPLLAADEQGNLHITGGDAGARNYAQVHAANYGNHLRRAVPELGDEEINNRQQQMEDSTYQAARAWMIKQGVQSLAGAGQRTGPLYWARRVPGLGAGVDLGWFKRLKDAADNFQQGRAEARDYYFLSHYLAEHAADEDRNTGGKILDAATSFIPMAAEWLGTGGLAPGIEAGARASVQKALSGLAGRVASTAAGAVVQGAVRTAANPVRLAEATMQRMVPSIATDEQGNLSIGEQKPVSQATWEAARSRFIENAVFSAGNPLARQAGESFITRLLSKAGMPGSRYVGNTLAGTGNLFASVEANKELQYWGANAPEGSTPRELWNARNDPEKRQKILNNLLVELAAGGLFEGTLHLGDAVSQAHDMLRSRGIKPEPGKFLEAAQEAVRGMGEVETPPPNALIDQAADLLRRHGVRVDPDRLKEAANDVLQSTAQPPNGPASAELAESAPDATAAGAAPAATAAGNGAAANNPPRSPADSGPLPSQGESAKVGEVEGPANAGSAATEQRSQPVPGAARGTATGPEPGSPGQSGDAGPAAVPAAGSGVLDVDRPSPRPAVTAGRARTGDAGPVDLAPLEKRVMDVLDQGTMETAEAWRAFNKGQKQKVSFEDFKEVLATLEKKGAAEHADLSESQHRDLEENAPEAGPGRYWTPIHEEEPTPEEVAAIEQAKAQLRQERERRPAEQAYGTPGAPPVMTEEARQVPGEVGSHDIVSAMSKLFDVPMVLSRIRQRDVAGQYATRPEAVKLRSRFFGDLGVVSHEVAHHIDKRYKPIEGLPQSLQDELGKLDYDQNQQRPFEGFAEYLRHYLTSDLGKNLAPNFDNYFRNWLGSRPELAGKLQQARSLIDQWRGQGSLGRVRGNIYNYGEEPSPPGESLWGKTKAKVSDLWSKFRYSQLDDLEPLERYSRAAKEAGHEYEPGGSPVELARAFRFNAPLMARDALEHGPRALSDGRTLGPSLKEAIGGIKPEEYRDFVAWLYARHAREAWGKGINPGISEADAKYVHENHGQPSWEEAAKKITDFANGQIDMLQDARVITPEGAKAMKEEWETFIPLMRVRPSQMRSRGVRGSGSKDLVDLSDPIKRRFGSDFGVRDPIQALVQRTSQFYDRAVKQIVQDAIVAPAKDANVEGLGNWIIKEPPGTKLTRASLEQHWPEVDKILERAGLSEDEREAARLSVNPDDFINIWAPDYFYRGDQPDVRTVGSDGRPELYRLDPDFARFTKGMDQYRLPWFLNMTFGNLARISRSGATALKLSFAPKHLANYAMTAAMQTKQSNPEMIKNAVQGLGLWAYAHARELAGHAEDPAVKLFKDSGVMLGNLVGMDYNTMRGQVRDMLKNSTRDKLENLLIPPGYEEASGLSRGLRAGVGAAQLPLKGFSKVAQFVTHTSDVAPRLSEFFGKLKERGYTMERLQAGDRPPMNILSEAINAAREVSIDFSRAGTIGRVMNQIIPFYNPALQGMDKMARSFAENPQRMLLRAGVLASVAAANWWLQKDDDWRKVAPGWLKYGFATFTDGNGKPILRLPHTHEYGWSIYAGTEAALDAMYEKNPGVLADWWENAKHRVIPKLAPSYATTPFEVAANYDLFRGRPIVPDYLRQGREPRDQTTGHATGLARWVGDKLNISPDMIDKALQGETGGMYGDVAGQLGAVRDMASGRMPNLADVPIAGGVGLRRDYVRDEQEFYERQHELKQQHGSALLRDPNAGPDPESARIDQYAKLVAGIRAAMKQANPTDRDEQFQYERYMAGAYRAALGREDLARYPNPLKVTDAPPEVQKVIDGWLGKVVERATVGRPQRRPDETWGQFNARREKWQASVQDAQNILKDAGIDKARQRALLIQAQRTKGKSRGLRPSYVPSLQSSGPAD